MFNDRENKVHYKSYKSGKHWVVKAIVTTSMGLTFISASNYHKLNVRADTIENTSSSTPVSSTNQTSYSDSGASISSSPADNSNQDVTSSTQSTPSNSIVSGLTTINGVKYFQDASGNIQKNVIENVNGQKMYFDNNTGALVTNQYITIDNVNYHADYNGYLTVDNSHTQEALMTNSTFNQNFHYNVPRGYANDIQSIIPHYTNGKVDYYDVYYLYNPYPTTHISADQWYHLTTKDFKTFTPSYPSDPTSIKNVAIPDPIYQAGNGSETNQVEDGNKTNWYYAATGSIIDNDGLLTKDQWGNPISKDAKLAYFTDFGTIQTIVLAYSNNGEQFHAYQDNPLLSATDYNTQTYDFRDIQVQRLSDNSLVGYVAGGWAKKIFVFTSTDGVNWSHNPYNDIDLSSMQPDGYNGPFEVETPLIRTINNQPFMFISWHGGNIRASAYVKGQIGSNGIFQLTSDSRVINMDGSNYKSDTYAGNSVNLDANNLINVNWSGDWIYSPIISQAFKNISQHNGNFTLSRIIENNNGQLVYIPIEPDNKLVNSYRVESNSQPIVIGTNNKLDFVFDNASQPKTISFTRNEGTTTITLDENGITVSRQNSINPNMDKDVTTVLNNTNISKMELYVDNNSIEAYLPETNKTYNIINFSSTQNEPYTMTVSAPATIDNYQFGSSDGSNTNDSISSNIQELQGYLSSDNSILNQLQNQAGVPQDPVVTAINNINLANSYLNTAESNIQTSKGLGDDARAGLYTDIANYYYGLAKSIEKNASSVISKNGTASSSSFNGNNIVVSNDKRQTGIITDSQGNTHYYDAQTGYESYNTFYINNGDTYYFDKDGNMVKNQFVEINPNTGLKYYFGTDGKALLGKQTVNGATYNFGSTGIMVVNDFAENADNTLSYYGTDGKLVTNDIVLNNVKLSINSNGVVQGNDYYVQSPTNNSVYYYLVHNLSVVPPVNNPGSFGGGDFAFGGFGLTTTGSNTTNKTTTKTSSKKKLPIYPDLVKLRKQAHSKQSQLKKDTKSLSKLNKHTKKYKKLMNQYNDHKKQYDSIVKQRDALAKYFKYVKLVKTDKATVKKLTKQSVTAKAKLKKHNTKANKASYNQLTAKIKKLNNNINKYNKYINNFLKNYK